MASSSRTNDGTGKQEDEAVTLTEFLTARLDEKAARWFAVHSLGCRHHTGAPCGCGVPERVLREVEAGRKILAAYQRAQAATSADSWESDYTQALEWAARVLAAVDRDHPDYDPAWEPGT